jgi:hypothetical protein
VFGKKLQSDVTGNLVFGKKLQSDVTGILVVGGHTGGLGIKGLKGTGGGGVKDVGP